jgi:hypothetical protein
MGFIDEQDDRFRRRLDLVDDALQAVFEFALHTGAGLQHAEIQADQLNILEHVRHIALGDLDR